MIWFGSRFTRCYELKVVARNKFETSCRCLEFHAAKLFAECFFIFQAYNPLVPQKNEVIMALSIEVPDKMQVISIDLQ
jgi:hypothetical protein